MSILLHKIARCDDITIAMHDEHHPCHKIVSSQEAYSFQIPEPWNGNLQKAQILFISSNPSISSRDIEEYPIESYSDKEIHDYFLNRFYQEYYREKVRFWNYVKKYSSWVMDLDVNDEALPDKICITEVVHCKSRGERGVKECCDYCAGKWLNEILSEFNGQYIILLGKRVEPYEEQVRKTGKPVFWMPHPVSGRWTDKKRKDEIIKWKKAIQMSGCSSSDKSI